MTGTRQRLVALAAVLTIATGCGAAPASIAPSPGGSQSVVLVPGTAGEAAQSPDPSLVSPPSSLPTVHPSSRPTTAPAAWSKPALIRRGECSGMTAAIDAAGRYHVAAVCDGGIRYLTSANGSSWKETSFVPPIDRLEVDPQLTLDGDTVYLAYNRLAPTDGGCGDDGLQDIGVYTRSRHLPGGTWSDPVRVGGKADRVQSFRVVDGVLHLTITTDDEAGPLYYESQAGPVITQLLIPDAVTTSLRVGDDGHPRIAYATGHGIRYARVDGSHLTIETVAATIKTNLVSPSMVLGPGDHAYILWTQTTDGGGGCAGSEPGPLDGLYFGTDAGGTWTSTRLSRTLNPASLTLDPSSGRIEVVVKNGLSLIEFTSAGGDSWTSKKIPGTSGMVDPLVRLNPKTHGVSVFAQKWNDTGSRYYLLTKS
jgi:hypothetical protein